MKTLLLNVEYTDNTGKYWQDSSIKNIKVTQEENETIHDTVARILKEVDFVELSYKGKPQNNVYIDLKDGSSKIVGYIYRVKSEIHSDSDYKYHTVFLDAWVDINFIETETKLDDIEM